MQNDPQTPLEHRPEPVCAMMARARARRYLAAMVLELSAYGLGTLSHTWLVAESSQGDRGMPGFRVQGFGRGWWQSPAEVSAACRGSGCRVSLVAGGRVQPR